MFHTKCLILWMRTNNKCPICKSDIINNTNRENTHIDHNLIYPKANVKDELERLYEMKLHYSNPIEKENEGMPIISEFEPTNAHKTRQSEIIIPDNTTMAEIAQLTEISVSEASKRRALRSKSRKYESNSIIVISGRFNIVWDAMPSTELPHI